MQQLPTSVIEFQEVLHTHTFYSYIHTSTIIITVSVYPSNSSKLTDKGVSHTKIIGHLSLDHDGRKICMESKHVNPLKFAYNPSRIPLQHCIIVR